MKRTQRIIPVRRLADDAERGKAILLAQAQRQLLSAEGKLHELRRYREDYAASFQARAASGCGVATLRDFQLFLARLQDAVRQQETHVQGARDVVQETTRQWRKSAQRAKTLDAVVDRWQLEETRDQDRRQQLATDERAQRGGKGNYYLEIAETK
jgi:flagellar FliJ protein